MAPAARLSAPLARTIAPLLPQGLPLEPSAACDAVTSVHSGWLANGFMLGPIASSLMVAGDEAGMQAGLDAAAARLAAFPAPSGRGEYYSFSN